MSKKFTTTVRFNFCKFVVTGEIFEKKSAHFNVPQLYDDIDIYSVDGQERNSLFLIYEHHEGWNGFVDAVIDQLTADKEAAEKEEQDGELCTHCNGSGEGQYDGTRCSHCHGKGVEPDFENDRERDLAHAEFLYDQMRDSQLETQ